MGKIKGWKRYSKFMSVIMWKSESNTFLNLHRQKEKGAWGVIYTRGSSKILVENVSYKEAMKIAMKYMRSHPNG